MTEKLHADDGADPSTKPCISKQIGFRYPSSLGLCLILIHSSGDKGEKVDEKKIS